LEAENPPVNYFLETVASTSRLAESKVLTVMVISVPPYFE